MTLAKRSLMRYGNVSDDFCERKLPTPELRTGFLWSWRRNVDNTKSMTVRV